MDLSDFPPYSPWSHFMVSGGRHTSRFMHGHHKKMYFLEAPQAPRDKFSPAKKNLERRPSGTRQSTYNGWSRTNTSQVHQKASKPSNQVRNEDLDQKPDCHSWWVSKMQSGREEDTLEERDAIKFCFKLGKKCHRNVWNASDCFSIILHESSISFWVA